MYDVEDLQTMINNIAAYLEDETRRGRVPKARYRCYSDALHALIGSPARKKIKGNVVKFRPRQPAGRPL